MRIVIDMQGAQTRSRLRGIGRYTLSLVEAILRNAPEHEYFLVQNDQLPLLGEETRKRLFAYIDSKNILTFASLPDAAWEGSGTSWNRCASELSRELFLADLAPDVVLITSLFEGYVKCDSISSIGKLTSEFPTAVIFYDLIPLLNPDKYLTTPSIRDWYNERIDYLRRADVLLSISEYASKEAEDTLELTKERVKSIGTAHNPDFFKPLEVAERDFAQLQKRYGIAGRYLMYNGSLEARKNLEGLIRAYALLNDELKSNYQLVFVGHVSSKDQQRIRQLAQAHGCADRLILTGHVDDKVLLWLFNRATLFVFPSMHEGFGLPALEAMACGTATIGSNVTSIPEVIGREDALFNPASPDSIAQKITRVLTDTNFREDLQQYALNRSHKFSWDTVARKALEAFTQLRQRDTRPRHNWEEFISLHRRNYARLKEIVADFTPCSDATLCSYAVNLAQNIDVTQSVFRKYNPLPEKLSWRIEGPFDSSYSLALLNRETALALHDLGHTVALHSTEGPGDFAPSQEFLDHHPLLDQLHKNCDIINSLNADVSSRNLYPPRVQDMESRYNFLHHFAWEETALPQDWVDCFNTYLQGITCLSTHVKKILLDNGVTVPMSVSGCGVDHWERISPDPDFCLRARSFKFLHVSSCFPRKGVDKLLEAYFQTFSSTDDCTLVIKTFSNPHNDIKSLLEERKKDPASPDVVLIERDLTEAQLKALYELCDAMVVPSRAEGFALPLAEAMLSGLDVITTAWGGQMDFCSPETAWLVDYKLCMAQTHINQFDSVWVEPDVDHLAKVMHDLYAMSPDSVGQKSEKGRKYLLKHFRWEDVAGRLVDAVNANAAKVQPAYPKTGWVTTWKTQCGIATYSQHLIEKMSCPVHVLAAHLDNPDENGEANVSRCWNAGDSDTLSVLSEHVNDYALETLVIQFNYSMYNLESLGRFIDTHTSKGKTVILTLHSTNDPVEIMPHKRLVKIKSSLSKCHRLLVHSIKDLNRLKDLGLVENVTLFPHGIKEFPLAPIETQNSPRTEKSCWQIASYGFFLPHKGLLELIEACSILRHRGYDICLNMINSEYPVPVSAAVIKDARRKISDLLMTPYVDLETRFLPDNESFFLLSSADMLVFPYQDTGESASGAVRYGLATGKPVVVTPIPIFEDVQSVVHRLPGRTPEEIADGIEQLMGDVKNNAEYVRETAMRSERWRSEHTYARLGRRLQNFIYALHQEHNIN